MSRTTQPTPAGAPRAAGGEAARTAPGAHRILTPDQISWGKGPESMPPGAQASMLHGDPAKAEVFAMLVKLPKGYKIPPHSHQNTEIVTVLSGAYRVGAGETADASRATRLPAGGFFVFEPGAPHYSFVEDEAILQVSGMGPWVTTYVNPSDDPRKALH
jgi:quercetin dioxygenase-like cupin family protein